MVQVLRATGRLSQEIDGRMLVLMLDEATKLKNVTNGDAIAHWINAFKILADGLTKETGLIVSISIPNIEDFPDPLQDQQIVTRFGQDHYVDLPNFQEDEAREFMRALLAEWVGDGKKTEILARFDAEADREAINGTFPFTEPAFDRFIQYVCRAVVTTPRDIQKNLDDFLNRAIDEGRHVLSGDFVEGLIAGT
jgi:hypothetical protein